MYVNLLEGAVPPSRAVRGALTVAPRVSILRLMINKTFGQETLGLVEGGRVEVTFGLDEATGTIRIKPSDKGYILSSKPRSRDLLIQVARHPDYIACTASIPSTPLPWTVSEGALFLVLPGQFCIPRPASGNAA